MLHFVVLIAFWSFVFGVSIEKVSTNLLINNVKSIPLKTPTLQDYQAIIEMQARYVLPWPSAHAGGHYRVLSNQQLQQLGQQLFSTASAPQNATAMALVIYDWTMPDFRRPNFYMTSWGNITTLGQFITYLGQFGHPDVPRMFGLTNSDKQSVLQQLQQQITRVNRWCYGEASILHYALQQLPAPDYIYHPVLYRGGGRDVPYFCDQFVKVWGLSIDECVALYIQSGQSLTVRPFWSSTSHKYVINHFTGHVHWYFMPSPSRSGWQARRIRDFSVDYSQDEYLFPAGSQFDVVSSDCVVDPRDGRQLWNITLREADVTLSAGPSRTTRLTINDHDTLPHRRRRSVTQCVSQP